MPATKPPDGQNSDEYGGVPLCLRANPLRRGLRLDAGFFELRHLATSLMGDAVLVGPKVPVRYRRLSICVHGWTRSCITRYGSEESVGLAKKRLIDEASVPNVISKKPAARAKFFRKSQNSVRPLPEAELQKSPGFQNCFQRSAVTPQYPASTNAHKRSAIPVTTPRDMKTSTKRPAPMSTAAAVRLETTSRAWFRAP